MSTPIENNTDGLREILQLVNALPDAGAGGTSPGSVYLYNAGDECEALTGGWSVFQNYPDMPWSQGTGTNSGGLLTFQLPGGSEPYCGAYGTDNAIDLTEYSTLRIDVTSIYGGECFFGVSKARSNTVTEDSDVMGYQADEGIVFLDISNLSGSYYIWFGDYTWGDSAYGASVSQIKLQI